MVRKGFQLAGTVFADFATDPILQGNGVDIPKLRTGDRVRAVKQICHPSQPVVIVDVGTQGRVELVGPGQEFVGVKWDNGLLLCCMMEKLEGVDWKPRVQKRSLLLTKSQMLAFESIFDLLIRLGFEEDTEGQRMLNRGAWLDMYGSVIRDHSVDFDQIAGRTVAQFVSEGLQKGFLLAYLKAN